MEFNSLLSNFKPFSEDIEGVKKLPTTGLEKGVTYRHDVEYAEIDGTKLHLQILIPTNRVEMGKQMMRSPDIKKYPCIVFTQGSAWFKQDVYANIPNLSKLAERGYVVAVVEYRHSGIAPFPAQAKDMRNAIRFMKKHAEEFCVLPDKVIAAGDSSGGHTALFAGIIKDDDSNDNLYKGISADVKGIINYFGSSTVMFPDSNPITVNHCLPDSPEGQVMGGKNLIENPELARALSFECNVDENTNIAPVLNIHGTADVVVNTKCSLTVYNRLKECGKDTKLVLLEGANHGGNEFWSDEVLDIVTTFIERCINL